MLLCYGIGDLDTVIDYSQFDDKPGSHIFTVLALSTTEQQVEFNHQFNVSGKYGIYLLQLAYEYIHRGNFRKSMQHTEYRIAKRFHRIKFSPSLAIFVVQ